MKIIFEGLTKERVNHVNDGIDLINNHLELHTNIDVKLIYFRISEKSSGSMFSIYYLLEGDESNQEVLAIDDISFKEAKNSWVDIFKS